MTDAIQKALQDSACVFDRLRKGKPEDHVYHLLAENCHKALLALRTQNPSAERDADYVPGLMHCAKCKFQLIRNILYLQSGTIGAGDNKTEPCPNGCGPLWPVTWKQDALSSRELLEKQFEEIEKLRAALGTREGEGWQPIESAPRDGTEIRFKNSQVGEDEVLTCSWGDYRTPLGNRTTAWSNKYGHLVCPTHWMPLLPSPPLNGGK